MSKKSTMMQLFTGCMKTGMATQVVLERIEAISNRVSMTTNRAMTAFRELFGNKGLRQRAVLCVLMVLLLALPAAADTMASDMNSILSELAALWKEFYIIIDAFAVIFWAAELVGIRLDQLFSGGGIHRDPETAKSTRKLTWAFVLVIIVTNPKILFPLMNMFLRRWGLQIPV